MPRYLIEAAAGVYTGSVYNDKSILRAGHHGEARSYRDGSTLLQKTHHRALTIDRYKVREGDNIILCTWKYIVSGLRPWLAAAARVPVRGAGSAGGEEPLQGDTLILELQGDALLDLETKVK